MLLRSRISARNDRCRTLHIGEATATKRLVAVFFISLLNACSTMSVEDFNNGEPRLLLEDYFEGNTRAWGFFEDRFGNVQRQFVVDIEGTWDGSTLTLDEDFVYQDGETENRVWKIIKSGENTYSGSTQQSVGEALGTSSGNAFHWQYDFNLKVGDSTWKVHFNDWMFLQSDDVLINKATVTRWGIKLGTVFLSFRKLENEDGLRPPSAT